MVIQHNISAINSHRNLGINNAFTAKNLEKLSSGYKINRAGDDAAGLAISEKMRGQIRGLAMAEQNTQNGVSLIQTAEGGLNETHAILQRMRELAVQASNGTYQDEDREQITLEFDNLKSEITRIAESTHYNGIKLLDGSLGRDALANTQVVTDEFTGTTFDFDNILGTTTNKMTLTGTPTINGDFTLFLDSRGEVQVSTTATGVTSATLARNGTLTFVETAGTLEMTTSIDMDRVKQILESTDDGQIVVDFAANGTLSINTATGDMQTDHSGLAQLGVSVELNAANAEYGTYNYSIEKTTGGNFLITVGSDQRKVSINDLNATNGVTVGTFTFKVASTDNDTFQRTMNDGGIRAEKVKIKDVGDATDPLVLDYSVSKVSSGEGLVFQIGANGGVDQKVGLSVDNMDAFSIGMKKGDKWSDGTILTDDVMLNKASVEDRELANQSIEIITAATNMVSAQRAQLGAMQNRLEHTLNNLGVTKENLTAAESSIRDVDMAKEMMEFTKNNILVQASQAMLAQANQLPQGVLQLLR